MLLVRFAMTTPPDDRAARPLSPRESQVVRLLDEGRTPKEVAFELGVSNATVRVLFMRARKKLGRPVRVGSTHSDDEPAL
jgi:DNA-binding NarL/FixJ family response regulator